MARAKKDTDTTDSTSTVPTHVRVVSHVSGPTRQLRVGRVLEVGKTVSPDEAVRMLDKGMAEDASSELVGQDLGLLAAQLHALPEAQREALLQSVTDPKSGAKS